MATAPNSPDANSTMNLGTPDSNLLVGSSIDRDEVNGIETQNLSSSSVAVQRDLWRTFTFIEYENPQSSSSSAAAAASSSSSSAAAAAAAAASSSPPPSRSKSKSRSSVSAGMSTTRDHVI